MAEHAGEKTLEPTQHRREQAREQGQFARSQDLVAAVMLVGAIVLLMYSGSGLADFAAELTKRQLGGDAWLQADRDFAVEQSRAIGYQFARVVFPLLGVLLILAAAANLGQTGIVFLPGKLELDWQRVSPLAGVQRLFSWVNAVRLGFGLVKIAIVASVALSYLWSQRTAIMVLGERGVAGIAAGVTGICLAACLRVAIALLILAIFDYGYQWWTHERELRMTQQEMREEMRQLQGDPQVVSRRRAVQRQLIMNRLSSIVPKADVIVTNPTELAIAIQYDQEKMAAPVVIAKGAGVLAQRIRRLALESSVPIVERKELARFLYKHVAVGKQIPSEQYAAVAEILRYVYRLKGVGRRAA